MAVKQTFESITHDDLVAALLAVPALELKGVMLLREYRATGQLPGNREELIKATEELIAYTEACAATDTVLRTLGAAPAAEEALVEGYIL